MKSYTVQVDYGTRKHLESVNAPEPPCNSELEKNLGSDQVWDKALGNRCGAHSSRFSILWMNDSNTIMLLQFKSPQHKKNLQQRQKTGLEERILQWRPYSGCRQKSR